MKNQKGITLVALVVTIIVLLILAGVSITMISGDDGIATRAGEAAEKTEEKNAEEEAALGSIPNYIDEKVNNSGSTTTDDDEIVVGPVSFSICGKTFYADEDMTFGQWVADTKYNTCGAKIVDGFVWVPYADWNEEDRNCFNNHEAGGCFLNMGEYISSDRYVPEDAQYSMSCLEEV